MRILLLHGLMFNQRAWARAADDLARDGIELTMLTHAGNRDWQSAIQSTPPDAVVFTSHPDLGGFDSALEFCRCIQHRVALVPEAPDDFHTIEDRQRLKLAAYLDKALQDNYANGIRYLASLLGHAVEYGERAPVVTSGIYHPAAESHFGDAPAYLEWLTTERGVELDGNLVAVLFYYGALAEQDLADIDHLVEVMEQSGLAPMFIFTEGMADGQIPLAQRYPWWGLLEDARPHLTAMCNFTAGRFLNRPDETPLLSELNLPLFQLIRLWGKAEQEWLADPQGVPSHSLTYNVAQPEMAGAIEPLVVSCQAPVEKGADPSAPRDFLPIHERMGMLCRRIRRWRALRRMSNADKRVTVVLHNPPCKGAEATVAAAAGMDAFQSLAGLLNAMRQAGYDLADAPTSGEKLKAMIMERKAISEFRWTTVDEIVRKGGVLHRMTGEEYLGYLQTLPEKIQRQIIADWDPFPGEGMVLAEEGQEPVLVITGLKFGNIKIMVQPKRGCYGAKCNGEVCRILHDPTISPPHHWLATYKYIRDNSDAVIHWGTEGALEYLPGKRAGLSAECYPEITLEDLPNLYPYIMNVPGEGLLAKRRGRAVLVDHLTPVYVPAPQDQDSLELAELLEQYVKARDLEEGDRTAELEQRMTPLLVKLSLMSEGQGDQIFDRVVDTSRRIMDLARQSLCPLGLHVLGAPPDEQGAARMLASILARPHEDLPDPAPLLEAAGADDGYEARVELIRELLAGTPEQAGAGFDLAAWAQGVAGSLEACARELPRIQRGLRGGYLEPGPAGSLYMGKTQTLPTGRNFYAMDPRALPTPAAWEVGRGLADELMTKYLAEEGRFPESVGQNLWSMDGFKSDGEILSHILHLMGTRPVWDSRGVTIGVKVAPLEELAIEVDGRSVARPRVDVLVQTSGIVRDMLPNFLELIDQAVEAVGGLDEPEDMNFILKHNRQRMAELRKEYQDGMDYDRLTALAGCRIFSSPPGSYGIGVGLAIDASAWDTDADLAEVYVNWGGFAYGTGQYGAEARSVYAGHLKNLDAAYMKQYSPEYDLVDCGCYASYQGGMAQAARTIGGRDTKLYWSTNTTSGRDHVEDFEAGLKAALGAKLFNPAWLREIKKHGYQGAAEVSGKVNNLFKWSATSRQVDKAVFDTVVDRFLRDPETLAWLQLENPYALEELTRRLLEAQSRGMWEADADDLAVVQGAALGVEGDLEETMGQVTEEFQGAKVEVMTAKDVDKWRPGWKPVMAVMR